MNSAFMTSAPGKVIVYGEHAVVYGKAAMAAAISLRSYLHVTTLSKSQRTITLNFPDVKLNHTWNIDELPWPTFNQPSKKKTYYDLVTTLDHELTAAMKPHLADISLHVPAEERKIHQNAAAAFLYLFLSLGSQSSHGTIYALRSTIPIGAGLGSSASISVCISSALLLQARALAGPHPDQPAGEGQMQIERINRWAFVSEMCIHGNPSGVDNTVTSYGKAVLFKRLDYSKPPKVVPLRNFPELPLLLVNTRQSRSTATEVAKVATLKKNLPDLTELLLNTIDKVTEAAHDLLNSPDYSPHDVATSETLGSLMNINHGLLVSLGVSHPRLDRIRELVDSCGVGYTKLTGAGGGGSAITLLKPKVQPTAMEDLEAKLDAENFERFELTLGTDGVGVLWPAVLKDQEIDLEGFLAAESVESIKELVGDHASEYGPGWKFWKTIENDTDKDGMA
ncbi:uncharacterized protein KY384_009187 [Bacidia gigantensis]|uniref:uncharacterized protein n=1 Tax=Bacidia gigantensis TaxID=2732470 RepID=UPI001D04296A|nr:uncharacterized protein KY384_009187 [Bacidia gigantensis]KAG8525543.1 hypothetical protein KY384_009187 [Bacidia gigantensis]